MQLTAKSIAPILMALTVPAIGYLGFSDRFAYLFGTSTDNAVFRREIVELRAPVTGQIVAVNVDDGDRASVGSTLMVIEQRQIDYDVDSARQEKAAFISRMSATSRAALASRRRTENLARAADHCAASLKLLGNQIARSEALISRGFVSRSAFDAIRANFEQRQSECLTLSADADAERRQLETIEADTSEMVGQYHGSSNQARKGEDEIRRGRLKAPFTAIIGNRRVAAGMTVSIGTPLLTVVSSDKIWVEANFREDQLVRLRLGTRVTAVTSTVDGHQFKGRIVAIGGATVGSYASASVKTNAGSFTRLTQWVPVRIALDADPLAAQIPAGASCQVRI